MSRKLRPFIFCLLSFVFCFASCSLFDNSQLERQRAELARLQEESGKLKQEADALRRQSQQRDTEQDACNRAFQSFAAGKKAGDSEAAVTHYKEGLALCPNDDVAHNELGELYQRLGRRGDAAAEFEAAVKVNPNFSRARKNLEALK